MPDTQPDDGDESTDYELSKDNTHNQPVEVTTVDSFGRDMGESVHVKETHSDGSTTTTIFTEEQSRKIFDRLKEIHGE